MQRNPAPTSQGQMGQGREVNLSIPCVCAAAIAAFAVLLFFFSPPWNLFLLWPRVPELNNFVEFRRAATLLQQLENPFAPIADPIHRILQWRLLFPIVGNLLHLPGAFVLSWPFIGAAGALGMVIFIARCECCSWLNASCGAIVLGASGWFFASTGWLGYFDSWLVVFLIVASRTKRAWLLWLTCLLAPWVDERFIIGLPLVFAFRLIKVPISGASQTPVPSAATLRSLVVAGTLAAVFVSVRIWLAGRWGSLGVIEYLRAQQTWTTPPSRFLLGLWESLRFSWCFVAIGLTSLLRQVTTTTRVSLLAVVLATVVVSLIVANDLSRSMTVLMPLAVEGFAVVVGRQRSSFVALPIILIASVIVPARHVVTDFTRPIPRFSSVFHAWKNPEGDFSAAVWTQRANQLMQENRDEDATRSLDLAIRLNGNFAPAYHARGLLAAKAGQWQTASESFSIACRLNPRDAAFQVHRAIAALQLHQFEVFRLALAEAKKITPVDTETAQNIAELEKIASRMP